MTYMNKSFIYIGEATISMHPAARQHASLELATSHMSDNTVRNKAFITQFDPVHSKTEANETDT